MRTHPIVLSMIHRLLLALIGWLKIRREVGRPETMKPGISLVIPCTPNHTQYMNGLLQAFGDGELRPKQVVVSLSNAHQVSRRTRAAIKQLGESLFETFNLLEHRQTMTHGPNRQAAIEHCTQPVISFFDADDLPYPNRISALTQIFSNPEIIHVNYGYTYLGEELAAYKGNALEDAVGPQHINATYFPNGELEDCNIIAGSYGSGLQIDRSKFGIIGISAGHPTVKRHVFDKLRWKDWDELTLGHGEDYEFDMECAYNFKGSYVIGLALSQKQIGHKPGNRVSRWIRRMGREAIGFYNIKTGKI